MFDLLDLAPGDAGVKTVVGAVLLIGGISGAMLMPNLGGVPMIGSEIKSVNAPIVRVAGATVRRKATGQEVGLREFKMEAGQELVFDYELDTSCGSFVVSVDKFRNAKLGPKRRLLETLSKPGAGQVRREAPEDGTYRLLTYANKRSRSAVRWTAQWHLD